VALLVLGATWVDSRQFKNGLAHSFPNTGKLDHVQASG